MSLLHGEGRQFESVTRYQNFAEVAQLVEHLFEAQGVGGSIPSLGTKGYCRVAQRKSNRLISDRSTFQNCPWQPDLPH